MTIFDELKKKPQAAKLLNNQEAMANVLKSPEAARLAELLKNSQGDLESAAKLAMGGDTSQLMGLINNLMANPEGAEAIQNLNKNIPK